MLPHTTQRGGVGLVGSRDEWKEAGVWLGRAEPPRELGLGAAAAEGENLPAGWVKRGLSLQPDFTTVFCKWIQLAWEQTLLGSMSFFFFFFKLADREV